MSKAKRNFKWKIEITATRGMHSPSVSILSQVMRSWRNHQPHNFMAFSLPGLLLEIHSGLRKCGKSNWDKFYGYKLISRLNGHGEILPYCEHTGSNFKVIARYESKPRTYLQIPHYKYIDETEINYRTQIRLRITILIYLIPGWLILKEQSMIPFSTRLYLL